MRNFFLTLLFSVCFSGAFSQNITLSGYIADSKTGEAIIGANVLDIESNTGTASNKFGYFALSVTKGTSHSISVSFVGYAAKTINVKTHKDSLVIVEMEYAAENLKEVVVFSENKAEERSETGKINIPVSTIKTLPAITGEPDVLKVFQLMPGVQMGAENANALFVRGGSADQNLFLLDDVPLYNVNHLGGFFRYSTLRCSKAQICTKAAFRLVTAAEYPPS
jgi:hypothetical protein